MEKPKKAQVLTQLMFGKDNMCARWRVLCEGSHNGAYVAFTPVHGARRVPIQVMRGPYMGRGWTSGLADCTEAASTPGQH